MLPSERATEVVQKRQKTYGHPTPVHESAAAFWSEILNTSVKPEQVTLCLLALKLAREIHKPLPDNLTDICGYANVYEMVIGGEDA